MIIANDRNASLYSSVQCQLNVRDSGVFKQTLTLVRITFPTRSGNTISPVAELTIKILVIEPENTTNL